MWSTKIIDFALNELEGDFSVFIDTPFFDSNLNFRKGHVKFNMTKEEAIMKSYLLENRSAFIDMMGPEVEGLQNKCALASSMTIGGYNVFVKNGRQVGASSIMEMMALYSCFKGHPVRYISPNVRSSEIHLEKFMEGYSRMPFYLKPGIVKTEGTNIEFDNGSTVVFNKLADHTPIKDYALFADDAEYIDANKLLSLQFKGIAVFAMMQHSANTFRQSMNSMANYVQLNRVSCCPIGMM